MTPFNGLLILKYSHRRKINIYLPSPNENVVITIVMSAPPDSAHTSDRRRRAAVEYFHIKMQLFFGRRTFPYN